MLTGQAHIEFHRVTEQLFEDRGVYDMTFGYNLAQLNRDTRHPDAGNRYAEETDEPSVLRAEFTPTTPFCPQSDTLTKGSLRAWNGLATRHGYDLVRVRVSDMHHQSEGINDALAELERDYREGVLPGDTANEGPPVDGGSTGPRTGGTDGSRTERTDGSRTGRTDGCSDSDETTSRGDGSDAPF